jgi:hypothetical protein
LLILDLDKVLKTEFTCYSKREREEINLFTFKVKENENTTSSIFIEINKKLIYCYYQYKKTDYPIYNQIDIGKKKLSVIWVFSELKKNKKLISLNVISRNEVKEDGVN